MKKWFADNLWIIALISLIVVFFGAPQPSTVEYSFHSGTVVSLSNATPISVVGLILSNLIIMGLVIAAIVVTALSIAPLRDKKRRGWQYLHAAAYVQLGLFLLPLAISVVKQTVPALRAFTQHPDTVSFVFTSNMLFPVIILVILGFVRDAFKIRRK